MSATKLPKARVRMVMFFDIREMAHVALVMVAGGQSFWIAGKNLETVQNNIERELDANHGDNWQLVKAIDLGRIVVADRRDIGRLLEEAV